MALFQCFYRHGLLPVMEIVFVLHKTEVVQDRSITFESVWGMPLSGAVTFTPLKDGKSTGLTLELAQAIPDMLLGVGVGPLGLQNSVEPILGENLEAFKQLAELAATSPERMPPRQEGGEQAYPLAIDERNMEYIRLVNSYAPDEDVVPGPAEPAQGAAAQQSGGEESAGEYEEGEEVGEDEEEVEERPATSGRGAAAATARGAAAAGLGAATVAGRAAARRGTAEAASSSTAGRAAAAPAPAATVGRRAATTAPSAPAAPAGRRVSAAAPGGGATAGSAGTDAGAAPVAGRKLRSRRTAS